jgi:Tfp pilus assembly protein PilX
MKIYLIGNNMKTFKQSHERGVTLLVAMVITATLLLVSTGVVALAVKEASISNTAKNSQFAFYAADSGIECALYWLTKNTTALGTPVTCGNSATVYNGIPFHFDIVSPYCATVDVTTVSGKTQVESRGHNTCDITSPVRVERALRVTY